MKVQSIQTNQTTNNCRKPNFKMRMLNDPRCHYIRLWSNETKDEQPLNNESILSTFDVQKFDKFIPAYPVRPEHTRPGYPRSARFCRRWRQSHRRP